MTRKSKKIMWIVIAVLAALLIGVLLSDVFDDTKSIVYSEFYKKLDMGEITELKIDGFIWTGKEYDPITGKLIATYKTVAFDGYGNSEFINQLIEGGVAVKFVDPNESSIWERILPIVGVVVVALIFWVIMRSAAGGGSAAMNVGKSKAHVQSNIKVRFTDVAGAEEEKEELQEVVEFLKSPKKFSNLGAKIPSGVLLVGPPGTGKTLFAKAVAGEAGVPFFSVSGSDFVEMYVGVGAKRVRDLFDLAKKNQPCIIFIDEIDAVGRRRGAGLGGGHDEREQTLNQILVQMDGFENSDGIIVMAATNREDILDPALLRPGRFDRRINVNLPDVKGREQILKVHARNKPMAADVNFKTVARITAGFSGAELANLLNEAAILAARAGKKLIGNLELYDGINKVLMGPAKRSRVVTESDKRCTAYHEAGHAILASLCKNCDPVHEVSIIPRGRAAGYTMTRPETDDNDVSYNKLVDNICMSLGGRVAEELVIKDITTGASADIQHVSEIARRMVTQWGMSDKLGLVAYDSDQPVFMGMEYGQQSRGGYSQETAAAIDAEVRRLVSEAHERAKKLLTENRSILDNMARVLVEKETIYNEEVSLLMKGASYKEVIEAMENAEEAHQANPFVRVTPTDKAHVVEDENESSETPETPAEENTEDKE
ncbi:MAG: ATP-dependent zinc metalloprotease FtsH [Clostridia bacterium]|nr:ATP-dependent zinc metalloprotease FtsH [Clostridia bacterium]